MYMDGTFIKENTATIYVGVLKGCRYDQLAYNKRPLLTGQESNEWGFIWHVCMYIIEATSIHIVI